MSISEISHLHRAVQGGRNVDFRQKVAHKPHVVDSVAAVAALSIDI